MATHHGKQKRAAKHKQRREARRKQRKRAEQRPIAKKALSVAEAVRPVAATPRPTEPERAAIPGAQDDGGYHPDRPMQAELWLALEEEDKLELVGTYHEALPAKQQPPNLHRHVALHTIVENQLASGDPPATRAALERLMGEGMSRHHALHAIGWVAAEHLRRAAETGNPPQLDAVVSDLNELSLASWLAKAGG